MEKTRLFPIDLEPVSLADLRRDGPRPCIWEYRPGFWTPGEAWALIDGIWERVNSSDVGMNARPVTQADLTRLFPDTPPLPAEAFKQSA